VDPRRRQLTGAALALAALPRAVPAQQSRIDWADIALLDGRMLKAADLTGRPVVVQMWASWCPFCARQNPHIEALHRAHGRDLVVIGFTIDKTEQAARDYLKKHGYTFAAAMATPQVERWFGRRRALPEVYVVDRSGRVVLREEGEMFPEDVMALARFARPAR
jgi:thiol-disulfide isomerase/thioredoxin